MKSTFYQKIKRKEKNREKEKKKRREVGEGREEGEEEDEVYRSNTISVIVRSVRLHEGDHIIS